MVIKNTGLRPYTQCAEGLEKETILHICECQLLFRYTDDETDDANFTSTIIKNSVGSEIARTQASQATMLVLNFGWVTELVSVLCEQTEADCDA